MLDGGEILFAGFGNLGIFMDGEKRNEETRFFLGGGGGGGGYIYSVFLRRPSEATKVKLLLSCFFVLARRGTRYCTVLHQLMTEPFEDFNFTRKPLDLIDREK